MGPLLVPKERREKHVAQPCVTPFRSQVLAVVCGPKSGTVCSPNGATMHATIVRCARAHVQLARQSFCCVAKNTLSEHRNLCYLSQPCPFCTCNSAVIVVGNGRGHVATDCAEPSACAATPLLDTSVWLAMARPCARRSNHRRPAAAAVVGLAHHVQGPAGPLNISLRQQPAPLCFTLVWGMRVLTEMCAEEKTMWQDVVTVLQDPQLFDPADVTKSFAADRVVVAVKVRNQGRFIADPMNIRGFSRRRTLTSVNVKNGSILDVALGRP